MTILLWVCAVVGACVVIGLASFVAARVLALVCGADREEW